MNSKIGNYTEDELAYDFFESLTKLFKSINTTIQAYPILE